MFEVTLFAVLKSTLEQGIALSFISALCLAVAAGTSQADCRSLPAYDAPPSAFIGCARDLLHEVAGDDLGSFFGFTPTIEITNSRFPQAYALPKGTIAISRGLLAELRSPEEFLFVLAHELGHAVQETSNTTALLTGAEAHDLSPIAKELDADRYALTLMKLRGRSSYPAPSLAVDLLERISHFGEAQGVSFSTLYPSIQVRLAALRAG